MEENKDYQIKRIEDILRCHIANVKVLKYDKDIDVSKIVFEILH